MDWKEFFKPTAGKVALAIILILIGMVSLFFSMPILDLRAGCFDEAAAMPVECPPEPPDYSTFVFFVLALVTFWPAKLSFSLGGFVLSIIWTYVLASAIMWLVSGRKGKKRRKRKR